MKGLRMPSTNNATFDMCTLLRINSGAVENLRHFIDHAVEKSLPKQSEKIDIPNTNSCTDNGFQSPKYGQPETPTEVENVDF